MFDVFDVGFIIYFVKLIYFFLQGAGEAIRGNLMQGVDQIFGHGEGAAKHQKIAQAGVEKMRGRGGSVGEGQGES